MHFHNYYRLFFQTTRLGKHVNELRRKTTDPTLARRAKVLVKRWRDLVIPAVASPAHTGTLYIFLLSAVSAYSRT